MANKHYRMTAEQYKELETIVPWSRKNGFEEFAQRHGIPRRTVLYWRRKVGLPRHPIKQPVRRGDSPE